MNRLLDLSLSLILFLIFAMIAWRVTTPQMVPTGDEPHYLVTAHSLVVDGDIQLLNNYRNHDYRIFYPGELAKRTTANFDKTRELPAFGLGPSLLLAPFYWVALTYFPANLVLFLRFVMCSITAIAVYQLLRLGRLVTGALPAWVVAGAALASPLVTYSSMFYPEIPASLFILLGLRQFAAGNQHPFRSALFLALFSGALVWLHPKYLALAVLIVLYTQYRFHGRARLLNLILTICCIGAWFLFLHSEYGSWSPNRIYGGWQKQASLVELIREEGLERIWIMFRMATGFWIDQRFGLIPYAPFYIAFFPALVWFLKSVKSDLKIPILLLFLFQFAALSWGAPLGGYAPPSRHIIVLLPLILLPVITLFQNWKLWQRILFVALEFIGWCVSVLMFTHYRLIFTDTTWRNPDGTSWFWENFHLHTWIPNMTATRLSFVLIGIWIVVIAIVSFLLYPRNTVTAKTQTLP